MVCCSFLYNFDSVAVAASSIRANNSTEANLDKFVKLPEFRFNQKPCKNLSVDEYLLTKAHSRKIVNIDHLKLSNVTTELDNVANNVHQLPISIDVKHDLFNTKYGLVRNVIYTGMYAMRSYQYYIYFNLMCMFISMDHFQLSSCLVYIYYIELKCCNCMQPHGDRILHG